MWAADKGGLPNQGTAGKLAAVCRTPVSRELHDERSKGTGPIRAAWGFLTTRTALLNQAIEGEASTREKIGRGSAKKKGGGNLNRPTIDDLPAREKRETETDRGDQSGAGRAQTHFFKTRRKTADSGQIPRKATERQKKYRPHSGNEPQDVQKRPGERIVMKGSPNKQSTTKDERDGTRS